MIVVVMMVIVSVALDEVAYRHLILFLFAITTHSLPACTESRTIVRGLRLSLLSSSPSETHQNWAEWYAART
jgi:hypothetical protein